MIHLALRRPLSIQTQISSAVVCKRFYSFARLTENSGPTSRGRLTNTNASGLMPYYSRLLKERPMKPQEGPIIKSIKEVWLLIQAESAIDFVLTTRSRCILVDRQM
jgi:hypothetical protein